MRLYWNCLYQRTAQAKTSECVRSFCPYGRIRNPLSGFDQTRHQCMRLCAKALRTTQFLPWGTCTSCPMHLSNYNNIATSPHAFRESRMTSPLNSGDLRETRVVGLNAADDKGIQAKGKFSRWTQVPVAFPLWGRFKSRDRSEPSLFYS